MGRSLGARCTAVKADNVARRQAWQSMRIMRRFTRADILTTAAIDSSNLNKYVQALIRFGFLEVCYPRKCGVAGSSDVLKITRDTGPRPPIMHSDQSMTDPNTGDRWYTPNVEDSPLNSDQPQTMKDSA